MLIFLLKTVVCAGALLIFGTLAFIGGEENDVIYRNYGDPKKRAEAMRAVNLQSAAPYAWCLIAGVVLTVGGALLLEHLKH